MEILWIYIKYLFILLKGLKFDRSMNLPRWIKFGDPDYKKIGQKPIYKFFLSILGVIIGLNLKYRSNLLILKLMILFL